MSALKACGVKRRAKKGKQRTNVMSPREHGRSSPRCFDIQLVGHPLHPFSSLRSSGWRVGVKERKKEKKPTRAISSPEWSTVSRAMPTRPRGAITSLLTTLTACMR